MAKGFFIDTTKCTACRGCQVACKQWKKNPAEATTNTGSHQNPADFTYHTFKLVRMQEQVIDGRVDWLFFPDQCRHCIAPPCKGTSDMEDENAVIHDDATGCVLFTPKTKDLKDPESVITACPYDVPRKAKDSNQLAKCDMCLDRVQNGLKPACVQACPVGAMNFGEYEEMKAMAKARLEEVKKKHPKASLGDPDDVRVIFLMTAPPTMYHKYAIADAGDPRRLSRQAMLAELAAPLRRAASRLFG